MGFWAGYWTTIKPLDIEEPVDVWIHRPVGYVLAKLARPTPITPNQITLLSIVFGVGAGVAIAVPFPGHLPLGAGLVVFAAMLDCADGMLARMRKTSSDLGRMLDGLADLASVGGAVVGAVVALVSRYREPTWLAAVVLLLAVMTIVTSSFHTTGYDYYKNVFLRLTLRGSKEGEGVRMATARRAAAGDGRRLSLLERLEFAIYAWYLDEQQKFVTRFDPSAFVDLDDVPAYDERAAAIYRRHCLAPMRLWRTFFGLGSLLFGLAVACAFGRPDIYLVLRLVLLNGLFYLVLAPLQRRGSREARAEIDALAPPGAPDGAPSDRQAALPPEPAAAPEPGAAR